MIRALEGISFYRPHKVLALASWGQAIRSSNIINPDPYFGSIPLALCDNNQLDLEFAPLLLGERILIDITAYEVITLSRHPAHARARESLNLLHDKGFIEIVDFREAYISSRREIINSVNNSISNPMRYQSHIIESNRMWDQISEPLSAVMGVASDPVAKIALGHVHAMTADGLPYNSDSRLKLDRILLNSKPNFDGTAVVSEMLRPYFEHVFTHIQIMKYFGSPIIDWNDLSPLYNSAASSLSSSELSVGKEVTKVREIFSNVMSDFRPSTAKQFVMIAQDHRVKAFRSFVSDAAETASELDYVTLQRLIQELAIAKQRLSTFGTGLNIAFAATGVMIGWWDSSTLTSMTSAAIGVAGQEFIGRLVARSFSGQTSWALPFVDARKFKSL